MLGAVFQGYGNMIRIFLSIITPIFPAPFPPCLRPSVMRMYRSVEVIDEKPVKEKLGNTRSVRKKAKKGGQLFVNGDLVTVSLMLKDLQGHVLNATSVDIDRKMIHTRLDNREAEKLADLADKTSEISRDLVKISTSKGSSQPLYHGGVRAITRKRKEILGQLAGESTINLLSVVTWFEWPLSGAQYLQSRHTGRWQ